MQLPEWQQKAVDGILGIPEISSVLSEEEHFHSRVSDLIIKRNGKSISFTLWFLARFTMSTPTGGSKSLSERQESQKNCFLGGFDGHWYQPLGSSSHSEVLHRAHVHPDCPPTRSLRKGEELALFFHSLYCAKCSRWCFFFFSYPMTHSYGNRSPQIMCTFTLAPAQRDFPSLWHSKNLSVVPVLQEKPPSGLDFSV